MYEFLKKFHVWKKKKKFHVCVCVCPNVPEAANALFLSHDYGSIFTLPSLIYLDFILVGLFLIFPK